MVKATETLFRLDKTVAHAYSVVKAVFQSAGHLLKQVNPTVQALAGAVGIGSIAFAAYTAATAGVGALAGMAVPLAGAALGAVVAANVAEKLLPEPLGGQLLSTAGSAVKSTAGGMYHAGTGAVKGAGRAVGATGRGVKNAFSSSHDDEPERGR